MAGNVLVVMTSNANMLLLLQEYVCVAAQPPGACVLDQSLPVETAASFFVNPLTGNHASESIFA